jgi:hypothetical protein
MFPVAVQAPADYQNQNANADLELIVEVAELVFEYVLKAVRFFVRQN